MPVEQPFRREGLLVALRRVEHHLDDAFHVTVRRLQSPDVDTKSTGDRRANLIGVELLAFDLAALDHILGERAENGVFSHPESERFHLTDQAALHVPGGGQRCCQASGVPLEILTAPRAAASRIESARRDRRRGT